MIPLLGYGAENTNFSYLRYPNPRSMLWRCKVTKGSGVHTVRREYTRTVQSMFLSGPEPGEQRKKDGYGSRLQQSDGLPYGGELQSWCTLQTRGVHFREGEGGRRRFWCLGKRGVYPSLYRPRGCVILLPSPMWD